ncbi:MAG: 50S ribosomal protein L17 [Dehalococcoidia bacterium]|nr:50S ribosomal protein L17 [Dehalococcoidia bacterium]
MRHRKAGRHLGRDSAHRKALYRNLVTDLLRYERITTTDAKAREIRPIAEKMITLGRRGDLHARRQALSYIYDRYVVEKVFEDIAPRMADRPGGYLRITRLEPRKGDGAKMAVIETVDYQEAIDIAEAPPAEETDAAADTEADTEATAEVEEPEAALETDDESDEVDDVEATVEPGDAEEVQEPEAEAAPEAEDEER